MCIQTGVFSGLFPTRFFLRKLQLSQVICCNSFFQFLMRTHVVMTIFRSFAASRASAAAASSAAAAGDAEL